MPPPAPLFFNLSVVLQHKLSPVVVSNTLPGAPPFSGHPCCTVVTSFERSFRTYPKDALFFHAVCPSLSTRPAPPRSGFWSPLPYHRFPPCFSCLTSRPGPPKTSSFVFLSPPETPFQFDESLLLRRSRYCHPQEFLGTPT